MQPETQISGLNPDDQALQRLEHHLNTARRSRDLSWNALATTAGLHAATLRRLRKWDVAPTDDTAAAVERVLLWQPGSIAAILRGGEPTPITPDGPPPTPPDDGTGDGIRCIKNWGGDDYYWMRIDAGGISADVQMVDPGGRKGEEEMRRSLRRFGHMGAAGVTME